MRAGPVGAGLAGAAALTGAVLSTAGPATGAATPAPGVGAPAPLGERGAGGLSATPDPRAAAVLERAVATAGTASYSGLRLVRGPAGEALVDVTAPATQALRAGSGQGAAQAWEKAAGDGRAPNARGAVAVLERSYDAALVGSAAVLGRAADLVEVRRRNGAVAARLWVDRRTGLVLRRERFDRAGRVVHVSAFVTLTVAGSGLPKRRRAALPAPTPAAWSASLDAREIRRLRSAGWPLPPALPPGLVLTSARRTGGPRPAVLHLRYTDGLESVSLFVQRGRLDGDRLADWQLTELGGRRVRVRDAGRQVVCAGPRVVYTVIADAAPQTVAAVVAALPGRQTDGEGGPGRLGRGLARVASWLNPLR